MGICERRQIAAISRCHRRLIPILSNVTARRRNAAQPPSRKNLLSPKTPLVLNGTFPCVSLQPHAKTFPTFSPHIRTSLRPCPTMPRLPQRAFPSYPIRIAIWQPSTEESTPEHMSKSVSPSLQIQLAFFLPTWASRPSPLLSAFVSEQGLPGLRAQQSFVFIHPLPRLSWLPDSAHTAGTTRWFVKPPLSPGAVSPCEYFRNRSFVSFHLFFMVIRTFVA